MEFDIEKEINPYPVHCDFNLSSDIEDFALFFFR